MPSLEKRYEAKHLEQMQTGLNRLSRMLRVNADQIATQISILQSKRELEPKKYGYQLKRNKRLRAQIDAQFAQLEEDLLNELNAQTSSQWALANKKNDLLVNSYIVGKVDQKYIQLNLESLNQFQKRFQNGIQLSDRVHNLTEINKQLYNDYIGSGITQGRSAASIARDLDNINSNPYNVKVFDADGKPTTLKKISPVLQPDASGRGVYRSPRKNLFRLTRTETNKAYRLADHERFQQLDFIVGVEIHLSSGHNLYDMCDMLTGRYPKEFKFSGFHPNCLCYQTSILKKKEEFRNNVSNSENEVKKIPRSAQRYAKTVKNKQQYDWQRDNFKSDGTPLSRVGGESKNIEPYKISVSPRDYVPKEKILKSAANSIKR